MLQFLYILQNVRLAKVALRPGAGNMVNGILRELVRLKVQYQIILDTDESLGGSV